MGALISRKQFDRVCGYIDDGPRQPGARLMLGGLRRRRDRWRRATSYSQPCSPTLGTTGGCAEEIFGPVIAAIPGEDEADAVRMANDSHDGLAVYLWSGIWAWRFARRRRSNPGGCR